MKIDKTSLKDLLLLTPNIHEDHRGYFFESYNKKNYAHLFDTDFVQDNESLSQKGVLRGLHFQQPPHAQQKLVRVIKGAIQDVVVDIRSDSPTYGQSFQCELNEDNKQQLFVPVGFAHGFLVLESKTIINYKCSNYYHPAAEDAILWNDKDLNINWAISDPILSEKDKNAQKFATFVTQF